MPILSANRVRRGSGGGSGLIQVSMTAGTGGGAVGYDVNTQFGNIGSVNTNNLRAGRTLRLCVLTGGQIWLGIDPINVPRAMTLTINGQNYSNVLFSGDSSEEYQADFGGDTIWIWPAGSPAIVDGQVYTLTFTF